MKVVAIIAWEKNRREEIKMLKNKSLEFFGKGAGDASSIFEREFCGFVVIETIDQFDKKNL